MSLGRYGVVSSTWARNRALQILAEVSEGQDPASVEYETRHGNTFRALAEEYIERHCSKKKSGPIDIQMINKDLLPRWGSRPVKEINRRDVIKLVDSIHDRGAPIQANRTLSLIKRMFNFGIDRDIVESNPTTRVRPPGKENRRQRVLTDEEIRTVWGKLPEMNRAGILLEAAIKLILITAQRRGEIVALEWSEIDDNWWTIPEDKAKNGLTHRVPLSPLALSILEELPRDGQYVFPRRTGRGHIETASADGPN